jgi:hypothetical protein
MTAVINDSSPGARVQLRQRLDALGKRARHMLVTASVLGPSFRLEDAANQCINSSMSPGQTAILPPSTGSTAPCTKLAASLAR